MVDAGLIVLASFISPYRRERRAIRDLLEPGEFHRGVRRHSRWRSPKNATPKGLYAKARRGELVNFTGVDAPYEAPEHAELRIDTTQTTPDRAAAEIIEMLARAGILGGH